MRKSRWALVILAVALTLGAVVFRAHQVASLEARTFNPPRGSATRPTDATHLDGMRDIAFSTPDGLNVRGWYVPSKTGATIVYVHGSPSTRSELLDEARYLSGQGYGALLFDLPGHGESDGTVNWGDPDRHALSSAIDFVAAQSEIDRRRIGLFGFSMGSAIAAQVAAHNERVSAVVLAGAFTDAIGQRHFEYRGFNPLLQRAAFWEDSRHGLDLEGLRTVDVVADIAPRPLLLVIGTADPTVPPSMTQDLYNAARSPKEILMIPDAQHGNYAEVMGAAYLERLTSFFDKSMPQAESKREVPLSP